MENNEVDIFGDDPEDLTTCWVCYNMFIDPITLKCSHTMCKECLVKVFKRNPLCPFCRTQFGVPFPDVNQKLKTIVDKYKLYLLNRKLENAPPPPMIEQDSMFISMPPEIIVNVLTNLKEKELGRLSQVCREVRGVTDDGWLWRNICLQTFPFVVMDPEGKGWKRAYKYRSQIKRGWEEGRAGDFKLTTMRGHSDYITCFDYYRNNIVTGSADSEVMIWKARKPEAVNTLKGHQGVIASVKFNEVYIISGGADHLAKVWDTTTGACLYTFASNNAVNKLLLEDTSLITGDMSGQVKIWDLRSGNCTSTVNTNHHQLVLNMSKMGNGNLVLSQPTGIFVYDPRNPNIPAANANIPHSVSQMIGDSEMFVAGSGMAANYARINLHNGASTAVVPGAHTNKFSIAGDDKHIYIGGSGDIEVFSLATNTVVKTLKDHTGNIHSLQCDENKLVSGSADNTIKVWDLKQGKRLYSLLGGSLTVRGKNKANPVKPGCSQMMYDESRVIGSFNSLVRVYSFGEEDDEEDF